jgi:hypothetical protein
MIHLHRDQVDVLAKVSPASMSAVSQTQPIKVEIKGFKTSHFLEPKTAPRNSLVETYHVTTLPSQFSVLSPELNAAIEAKIKGQERTLADYLPGSADSRRRLDEITRKYSLSPEDQKRSDDLNRRTAESVERQANRR